MEIGKSIDNSVFAWVRGPIYRSVRNSVSYLVRKLVSNSVWVSVWR